MKYLVVLLLYPLAAVAQPWGGIAGHMAGPPAPSSLPPAELCSAPLTGAVAADVASVGFNTVAFCNDFTTTIPNTHGTGLASNWLNCNGNNAPVAGNVWHLAYSGSTNTTSCSSANGTGQITQKADTNGGGGLALNIHFLASQMVSGNTGDDVIGIGTIPYPNNTGWSNTTSWAHGYFEWIWRAEWNGGQGFSGLSGHNIAFWSDRGITAQRWEPDWFETIFGCCDTVKVGWGGEHNGLSFNYSVNQAGYHTLGVLYTGNTAGTQGAFCVYIDGSLLSPTGCLTDTYVGGLTVSQLRNQLILYNGIMCNGAGGDISCQTPANFSSLDIWVKRVRVFTCPNGPTGDACLTTNVFTR